MQRLRFRMNIITPMFLGGVDPLVAETRPASIMGILRYWYRILIANKYASDYGINSPRDWEDYKKWADNRHEGKTLWERVYEDEGKLFGTQERAGKVRIRMNHIRRKLSSSDVRKWTDGEFAKKVSYIGYGPILYVNLSKDRYRHLRKLYSGNGFGPVRGFFTSDSRLTEPVKVLRDIGLDFIVDDETISDKLIGLLWFVSMFGSLGSRSRKGWGSFHLIPEGDDHGFKSWEFDEQSFKEDFEKAWKKLSENHSSTVGNIEVYFAGNVIGPESFNGTYRSYFFPNPRNYRIPRNIMERIYFGLPRGKYKERRGSPVHFKLLKRGLLIIRKLEPFHENSRIKPAPGSFNLFLNSLGSYKQIY